MGTPSKVKVKPATPLPWTTDPRGYDDRDLQITTTAARKLYEKGYSASSIVRSLRNAGHHIEAVARAVRYFSEMDAMLFADAWCGSNPLESHKARGVFLATIK